MTKRKYLAALLASAMMGSFTGNAVAQTAGASPATAAPTNSGNVAQAPPAEEIVVTGTLLRRTNTETPSPVSVITAEQLEQRGINTISDALQTLSVNNAGALPSSFSANGAFANGASGASLRGLTTDSTLVLFGGLRAAYYPLADDGARNFVDLNTIPDAIVDHIDVLRDGASANFGADAVAGVINVLIKKEIKGFEGTAENGISERGDAAERRFTATFGFGDLATQGYNVYFSGEYQKDDALFNSERDFPFNTADLSRLSTIDATGNRVYAQNNNVNGLQGDGSFLGTFLGVGASTVAVVRPATSPDGSLHPANPTDVPGSGYQLLNPAAGCRGLTPHVIAPGAGPDPTANYGTQCEQNLFGQYGVISPNIERLGGTVHATKDLGGTMQAYALFTYYQDRVSYLNAPASIQTRTNSTDFSTYNLLLPPTLTNGQPNPNDPFAANGQYARLFYRFGDIPRSTSSISRTYRGAAGIKGSFGNAFDYTADVTGMETDLTTRQVGVPYFANVLSAVADGSYNFVNPEQNTAAVRNFISPDNVSDAKSKLFQGTVSLRKSFFNLPGGPVQVAVGADIRYEAVTDGSPNPANPQPDASQQFYPLINGFGAKGHRYVESGFFEIGAPVFKQLEVNIAGRYDTYSEGYSRFSPKVGVKFTPIRQLALRGTFSKGFRAPSFAETGSLPTTGFVNVNPGPTDAALLQQFLAAHGQTVGPNGAILTPASSYASQLYGLGLTTEGTTGLKPEISTNFTAGVVAQPLRWLSFTVDYYNIRKTQAIVGANYATAVTAFYAAQPIPTGFAVTPDIADPSFPTGQRRIANVTYGFINANSVLTDGIDFGATANLRLPHDIKWSSSGETTLILRNNQTFPDGSIQRYAGTLGPFAITSASGTPRWRANWQNTFTLGKVSLTGTAYYTSGYRGTADDYSGAQTSGSCSNAVSTYLNSNPAVAVRCNVRDFVDFDMNLSIQATEKARFYVNVLNLFDVSPPFDPNTYGGNNYNPAWANSGIVGRYFRAGVSIKY